MGLGEWLFNCACPSNANNVNEVELVNVYDDKVTPLYRAIEKMQWASVNNFLKTGYWKDSFFADPVRPQIQVRTWMVRYEEVFVPVEGSANDSNNNNNAGLSQQGSFPDPNQKHQSRKQICWKQLPLHAAIIYNAPAIIIQKLMHMYPKALRCGDNKGNLPIHLAFRHGSNDAVLALLLQEYPESMNCRENNGLLPTECATDLPSPQPLRGALLKTTLPKDTKSVQESVQSRLQQERFFFDDRSKTPHCDNLSPGHGDANNEDKEKTIEEAKPDQLAMLNQQMESLRTTVTEALSKQEAALPSQHTSNAANQAPSNDDDMHSQRSTGLVRVPTMVVPSPQRLVKKQMPLSPTELSSLQDLVSQTLAGENFDTYEQVSDLNAKTPAHYQHTRPPIIATNPTLHPNGVQQTSSYHYNNGDSSIPVQQQLVLPQNSLLDSPPNTQRSFEYQPKQQQTSSGTMPPNTQLQSSRSFQQKPQSQHVFSQPNAQQLQYQQQQPQQPQQPYPSQAQHQTIAASQNLPLPSRPPIQPQSQHQSQPQPFQQQQQQQQQQLDNGQTQNENPTGDRLASTPAAPPATTDAPAPAAPRATAAAPVDPVVEEQRLQLQQQQMLLLQQTQTFEEHQKRLDKEVKMMEEKMQIMENTMKEMYKREKSTRKELALTVKEVKHWKSQAEKVTVGEEKNRILTEILQDLAASAKNQGRTISQKQLEHLFQKQQSKLQHQEKDDSRNDESLDIPDVGVKEEYDEAEYTIPMRTGKAEGSPSPRRRSSPLRQNRDEARQESSPTAASEYYDDNDRTEDHEYREPPKSNRHSDIGVYYYHGEQTPVRDHRSHPRTPTVSRKMPTTPLMSRQQGRNTYYHESAIPLRKVQSEKYDNRAHHPRHYFDDEIEHDEEEPLMIVEGADGEQYYAISSHLPRPKRRPESARNRPKKSIEPKASRIRTPNKSYVDPQGMHVESESYVGDLEVPGDDDTSEFSHSLMEKIAALQKKKEANKKAQKKQIEITYEQKLRDAQNDYESRRSHRHRQHQNHRNGGDETARSKYQSYVDYAKTTRTSTFASGAESSTSDSSFYPTS